jgi:hypothetical protein
MATPSAGMRLTMTRDSPGTIPTDKVPAEAPMALTASRGSGRAADEIAELTVGCPIVTA